MIRVALVHDWLTGMRGGERVLEAIAELFPKAELFTLLYVPGSISPILTTLKRHTSWLQKIPGAEKRYRNFLPVMPNLIERFDLSGFDLIVSSSHCVAKGIRKPAGAVHVSYVHAPMRYMWDRYDDYFGPGRASPPVRLAAAIVRKKLQRWDRAVSQNDRVDRLVANSRYIGDQIEAAYGRKPSRVIYPFVESRRFQKPREPGRNYLMVGAFAPNKRVDIAIEAFNQMGLPLLIVGGGQDEGRLKKLAGPTIDFLGAVSDSAIADLFSKCRAFVFPGKEDFGITPLEAMAAGAPVIALGQGGALETVTERTGVLFSEQRPDSLCAAIARFDAASAKIGEASCRARAAEFTRERFQIELISEITDAWAEAGKDVGELQLLLANRWKPES